MVKCSNNTMAFWALVIIYFNYADLQKPVSVVSIHSFKNKQEFPSLSGILDGND